MTIYRDKVQLVDLRKRPELQKKKTGRGILILLTLIEGGLTLVLGLVLAATKIFTPSADSASGVVNKLSYQGRLTDTSGNALGGSGTNYCFRFSIYDDASAGAKVWPAGTPATTTLSVVNGVFNADIGSADSLTYDFYPTSTVYLNVEVNSVTSTCTGTWESLTPRQQILATGYAIAAENVYGDVFRTDVTNRLGQLGTRAGAATTSIQYLALDIANVSETIGASCSTNGTLWYNSNASNTQTLVCENGTIQAVVNSGGTTLNGWQPYPYAGFVAAQQGQGSLFFKPADLPAAAQFDRVVFPINFTGATNSTGQFTATFRLGLYTKNAGTLSLAYSQSMTTAWTHSGTASSSNLVGPRAISMAWTTTVNAGNYWLGFVSSTASASANASFSNFVATQLNSSYSGILGVGSNATNQRTLGLGRYTAATNGMPSAVPFSDIQGNSSAFARPQIMYFINGTNT